MRNNTLYILILEVNMKRLFPLLMIFIIAIFIIGCDNKTPEETVLGIKQVSLDTNVPPSDQLATIT